MANILLLNTPFVSVGLPTYTFTIPSASIYRISCQVTVPSAVGTGDGAGSGGVASGGQNAAVSSSLVIVVKQNGSTKYMAPTFSPTQSALQFNLDLLCAASDAIEIDFTSSGAPDNLLNTVQSTCAIMNVNGV